MTTNQHPGGSREISVSADPPVVSGGSAACRPAIGVRARQAGAPRWHWGNGQCVDRVEDEAWEDAARLNPAGARYVELSETSSLKEGPTLPVNSG
jgi:hypothetical protein